jgi:hypothetical protein
MGGKPVVAMGEEFLSAATSYDVTFFLQPTETWLQARK